MESSFLWTSAFQMMGRLHLDFQREEYNVSLPGVLGQPLVSDFCVEAPVSELGWDSGKMEGGHFWFLIWRSLNRTSIPYSMYAHSQCPAYLVA